ncbi:MAG: flagellin [Candidatus Aminicenantes bacterium]|nr:flagellin [Candidatus Aminicenantes bacterium]
MSGQAFSVLNNFSSMKAQKDLYFTNIGLNSTLAKLSSGKRIVDAGDDAAGLAIAASLKADSMALQQAVRNANDGIAIVQIADGSLNKLTDLLMRAVTLAEQSASDTVGADEKAILDVEYREILNELDRVVSVANFKGERLFSVGNAFTKGIYVGDTQFSSFITISIGGPSGAGTAALGLANTARTSFSSVATQDSAIATLRLLQTAIASLSRFRGVLGAQQNRLINAVSIIQVQELNIRAAESSISDANMAEEIVNMTKWQILLQSGMSSLAQANASSQMVLQLLR